ncbi:hypothetical protein WR25_21867 [Diploscapter pachys]|uniref:phosphatidylinositol-3,5-bisphosphate 3-phosphatase n=1 Tax=Diploscapter pachys TaxID=2018661 RepID=A0A2A2M076_9BILA|nr:hypothetical protein WR25_21867 [Diploscapter pachys]
MSRSSSPGMKEFIWQLPGEELVVTDRSIVYISPIGKIPGKVIITRYRLRFEAKDSQSRGNCNFDIPLGFIYKVEKIGHSTVTRGESNYGLIVHCKDVQYIRFAANQATHSRRPLVEALLKYAFPLSSKLPFYAVLYAKECQRPTINGWTIYEPKKEFARQGVPNELWQYTDINTTYNFADTYPRVLMVPKAAALRSNLHLRLVGEHRSRQRIPVLSWIHPHTQATITRSSQPMAGIMTKKSNDDEMYLRDIVDANANAHQLLIFDARPMMNAKVNRAKGGGFEENYDQCALQFLNIHNIHVVRESLRKLREAIYPRVDEKNYWRMVDESKWLNHIQSIMEGASQIAHDVEQKKCSVLVHCSDGWDRTAQLTSLAMLQLDPYYRTIEGFAVLIEKEWCSFGHKFSQRIGHGEDKPGDSERSPVFLQFIDCVWQIMKLYGHYFEFTSTLLIEILDELYACRFGTFLYNSEKQRIVEHRCHETTISLWSYILENRTKYLNPLYRSQEASVVILMTPSIRHLHVWNEYYGRHNPSVLAPGSEIAKRYSIERAIGKKALLNELMAIEQNAAKNRQPVNTTV